MAVETTFAIIKPNAMKKNVIGQITDKWESNDLTIAGIKKIHMSDELAKEFYAEHKERPFFGELVEFMTSAPVVVLALQGEGAVLKNRQIMGATNPAEAEEGTIRKLFGDSMGENAVHGSDSTESAERELGLFFEKSEIF
ncbi:MAG: nucleoside-diphosphate kinase [Bdellovibrionales bacterium]